MCQNKLQPDADNTENKGGLTRRERERMFYTMCVWAVYLPHVLTLPSALINEAKPSINSLSLFFTECQAQGHHPWQLEKQNNSQNTMPLLTLIKGKQARGVLLYINIHILTC